ncbi:aspartate kinase [Bacillus methanolicus]|uniref:Aspartokinase n=3 Tax=Bacillus TaxID=1386 RepID=AK_BACSG|nr:aspartate kinase [Bacillus methanolicus]Q59229.1 RecName: Full=Aspartokinase; AltName: Full=Aspartate kinase [Bacillus sp. MGA3]AAA22251.1 aspartokinase II [Bacillus sp. (in: firmicutes)]AIE60961.1 Aspartokinase [Bacillus methanolicus MGA3]EIJ84267.1 aspartate kinase-2 [Bacillus methanolicus MGA3]UQD52948.1 aspartate kinase [Bacillus methanolicus]
MGLIVQKFGGTSVGSVERILNVANRVIEEKKNGNDVVVVVSAMGKTTDELVDLAKQISAHPPKREMDMLLTTGEQVTISLLAMALNEKGYEAISYTGWQAGITTEPVFGNARILNIETEKIQKQLNEGKIVVVAGFQGIDEHGEITTLGRGGSDTTAVALAAALKAEKCDIYTDVTGVFTTDPRYVKSARKLASISYDEMLELANLGAGVLHPRAVEFAKNYGITLEVRSSMEREEGTIIEEEVTMEQNLVVRGVAFEDEITRVTVFGLPNSLTSLSTIFTTLAQNRINVDIIIQSATDAETTNLSFSIKSDDLEETMAVLENNKNLLNYQGIESETGLAKVSIVGSGMISNPGVAAKMFEVLALNGIQVKMVSTSEIKVSTVVEESQMIKAVEALHQAFELSGSAVKSER